MADVFLSYARADLGIAKVLANWFRVIWYLDLSMIAF